MPKQKPLKNKQRKRQLVLRERQRTLREKTTTEAIEKIGTIRKASFIKDPMMYGLCYHLINLDYSLIDRSFQNEDCDELPPANIISKNLKWLPHPSYYLKKGRSISGRIRMPKEKEIAKFSYWHSHLCGVFSWPDEPRTFFFEGYRNILFDCKVISLPCAMTRYTDYFAIIREKFVMPLRPTDCVFSTEKGTVVWRHPDLVQRPRIR